MGKTFAMLVMLAWSALTFALEAAPEAAIDTGSTGIVVFILVTIACAAGFGWMLWRNEHKSEQDKLGEKF